MKGMMLIRILSMTRLKQICLDAGRQLAGPSTIRNAVVTDITKSDCERSQSRAARSTCHQHLAYSGTPIDFSLVDVVEVS